MVDLLQSTIELNKVEAVDRPLYKVPNVSETMLESDPFAVRDSNGPVVECYTICNIPEHSKLCWSGPGASW